MPPSRQQHIGQAEHNEALFHALEATNFTDWAVTALFYAALHLVDAFLWPVRLPSHARRGTFIAPSSDLSAMYAHYRELQDRSEDARYECVSFTAADVQQLFSADFFPIRQRLRQLLNI
jgi:hypothetical protein